MENYLDIVESLKKFYYRDQLASIKDAPPTISERRGTWASFANKKYIFISYSHYDYDVVYKDLRALWSINANYWYDREYLFSDTTDDWYAMARSRILDKNCVGVLFYASTNSFLSDSVYQEILACKERLEHLQEGESFSYKVIMLGENSIIDIQNKCKLPSSFTSQRLIDVHLLWGTEKIHICYSSDEDHIFHLVDWFVKTECINDMNFDSGEAIVARENYILVGNALISYFGTGTEFSLESGDRVTIISTKSIASPFLKTIRIPEGVIEIEDFAIISCTHLEQLFIPSTVEKLGFFALSNFNYSHIEISPENKHFKTDGDGFVYRIVDGVPHALYACPNKNRVKKLIIEDTVCSINDFAISYCDFLEEIVFPKQLKRIGFWSVKGNRRLKKITLYPGIEYVSNQAFLDTDVEEVFFMGTKAEWESSPRVNDKDTLGSLFHNAVIHFSE